MADITHLSLFTGIGGADLAASWAGIKTVAQSEIEPYCVKVLEKNFPGIPNLGNIKSITRKGFHHATGLYTVDIISGGFPCQPFSVAGKRRGKADYRYLWPKMCRVIKKLKPTWVIGENVAGFIRMGLDDALSDLEAEGYETRAFVLPACGVGAPHQRYRCFILGYSEHNGLPPTAFPRGTTKTGDAYVADTKGERCSNRNDSQNQWEADREVNSPENASLSCGDVSNTDSIRQQEDEAFACVLSQAHTLSCCGGRGGGHSQTGGSLNPTWEEWLMGFPMGWTELKP